MLSEFIGKFRKKKVNNPECHDIEDDDFDWNEEMIERMTY